MRSHVERRRLSVALPKSLFASIKGEADRVFPLETGGILIGCWTSEHSASIEQHIGPGPRAIHKRSSFAPDYDYHEAEVARLYEQSLGRLTYLGDWHTHPRGGSYLSPRDRATLRRIAKSREARTPTPLMAIMSGGDPWKFAVWSGRIVRGDWSVRLAIELSVLAIT